MERPDESLNIAMTSLDSATLTTKSRSSIGRPIWAVPCLAIAFALSGCGSGEITIPEAPKGPLHPAKGKVLLGDGQPLTEGSITLFPIKQPGRLASGKIGGDGAFTLKTGDLGDGALEGDYRVSIDSSLKGSKNEPVVPPEYTDSDGGTILTVTVKAGNNELEPFKLVPGALKDRAANTKPTD